MTRITRLAIMLVGACVTVGSALNFAPTSVAACGTSVDGQCVGQTPPPLFLGTTPDAVPEYAGKIVTVAVTAVENITSTALGDSQAGAGISDVSNPAHFTMSVNNVQMDNCCLSAGLGGDACQVYTCTPGSHSVGFADGNWTSTGSSDPTAVTGSVSAGLVEQNDYPTNGHLYLAGDTFQSIAPPAGNPQNLRLCSSDSGMQFHSNWPITAPTYNPSTDSYQSNSQTYTVGAEFDGVGMSLPFTTTSGFHYDGGWDADYVRYGSSEYYEGDWPNGDCPQVRIGDTGAVTIDLTMETFELTGNAVLSWRYSGYTS